MPTENSCNLFTTTTFSCPLLPPVLGGQNGCFLSHVRDCRRGPASSESTSSKNQRTVEHCAQLRPTWELNIVKPCNVQPTHYDQMTNWPVLQAFVSASSLGHLFGTSLTKTASSLGTFMLLIQSSCFTASLTLRLCSNNSTALKWHSTFLIGTTLRSQLEPLGC